MAADLFVEPALEGMPDPVVVVVEDTPPNSRPSRTRVRASRAKKGTTEAAGRDKAPRVRPPRTRTTPRVAVLSAEDYGKKLMPLYAIGAMVSRYVVGAESSALLLHHAPTLANSWGPLAVENESVRALIDKLTESQAVLGVVMAHALVAGAVLAQKGHAPMELMVLADALANPDAMADLFTGGVSQESTPPAQANAGGVG